MRNPKSSVSVTDFYICEDLIDEFNEASTQVCILKHCLTENALLYIITHHIGQ